MNGGPSCEKVRSNLIGLPETSSTIAAFTTMFFDGSACGAFIVTHELSVAGSPCFTHQFFFGSASAHAAFTARGVDCR
jgi:hypothetical protein